MTCKQIQELFPELKDHPDRYPEALLHLRKCSNCKTLFHIFNSLEIDASVKVDPVKRDVNLSMLRKKMKHHDRVVFTRRVSAVAAVFLLSILTVFNINQSPGISIADISDDVLYMQSETTIVPETGMDQDQIIEYLAEYEDIESLGNLFQ